MKSLYLTLIFLLINADGFCNNISICSWNLKDFGKSKSDSEIAFVANILQTYDVIAIQEVVAGYGGAQAVVRLVNELNLKGSRWDYSISDPTSSSAYKVERYAYLWKTNKVKKKGDAWLESNFHLNIDREPYFIRFQVGSDSITVVNFHAITKSRQPETEVKYFKFFPDLYPNQTLIFVGDFNLPQTHTVFNPLKGMGYEPVLIKQKTSLRQECINDDCLASEFDNIFINKRKSFIKKSGIILFYLPIDFEQARLISDHVPIFAEIELRN